MAVSRGHLLHVGYPKTGSKFLQRWFLAHPDISFSPWGIAGFGNAHGLVEAAAASPPLWLATSHEALLTPVPGLEDMRSRRGVALPARAGQTAACAMLARLFPNAHILIVTRGYEALIRSFYGELVLSGATYGFGAFCEALLAQVERSDDVFDFDSAIGAYAAAFGEERLLVLPYELLRDRPTDFLEAIAARLGLPPRAAGWGRVRASPPGSRVEAYRRMTAGLRRVPLPLALRRRYVAALRSGRLALMAAAVERLGGGGEPDPVPARLVEALAGRTGRLLERPYFKDYARDYRA
jgi:hypothetical protein